MNGYLSEHYLQNAQNEIYFFFFCKLIISIALWEPFEHSWMKRTVGTVEWHLVPVPYADGVFLARSMYLLKQDMLCAKI